ncbi:hypothetical protein C8J57DRAFT_1530369 [Mycena rebaudengoi]|nr:hypothetical protein C8J57DRAFT_1530369 [Mycena rebaudengoi]
MEMEIPENIQLKELIHNLDVSTALDLGSEPRTSLKELALVVGKFQFGTIPSTPYAPNMRAIGNWILWLQILNLIGLKLHMNSEVPHSVRYKIPFLTGGRTKQLFAGLKNWPAIIKKAKKLHKYPDQRVISPPTQDEDGLLIKQMYYLLSSTFKPSKYKKIVSNLKLAAFCLAWHCQGNAELPKSLELLFKYFESNGLKMEVERDRVTITKNFQQFKPRDLAKPLQIFLGITPIALLLPMQFHTYQLNDLDLLKIFMSLGTKPERLARIETALRDVVWNISDGSSGVDEALTRFFERVEPDMQVEDEVTADWFTSTNYPEYDFEGSNHSVQEEFGPDLEGGELDSPQFQTTLPGSALTGSQASSTPASSIAGAYNAAGESNGHTFLPPHPDVNPNSVRLNLELQCHGAKPPPYSLHGSQSSNSFAAQIAAAYNAAALHNNPIAFPQPLGGEGSGAVSAQRREKSPSTHSDDLVSRTDILDAQYEFPAPLATPAANPAVISLPKPSLDLESIAAGVDLPDSFFDISQPSLDLEPIAAGGDLPDSFFDISPHASPDPALAQELALFFDSIGTSAPTPAFQLPPDPLDFLYNNAPQSSPDSTPPSEVAIFLNGIGASNATTSCASPSDISPDDHSMAIDEPEGPHKPNNGSEDFNAEPSDISLPDDHRMAIDNSSEDSDAEHGSQPDLASEMQGRGKGKAFWAILGSEGGSDNHGSDSESDSDNDSLADKQREGAADNDSDSSSNDTDNIPDIRASEGQGRGKGKGKGFSAIHEGGSDNNGSDSSETGSDSDSDSDNNDSLADKLQLQVPIAYRRGRRVATELPKNVYKTGSNSQILFKKKVLPKARKVENNSDEDDDDIVEIPFIDLTGSDDVWVKDLEIDTTAAANREKNGLSIVLYSADKSRAMRRHIFRSFNTPSAHPLIEGMAEFACENEYRIAREIQAAFLPDIDLPNSPLPTPKYHLDTASCEEYTPGCSIIFTTTAAQWKSMSPALRRKIFSRRHILVSGLGELEELEHFKFGVNVFGTLKESILDLSKRTSVDPLKGLVKGDARQFLKAAQDPNGTVLNILDIRMDGLSWPDPPGFRDLNTNEVALAHTRSMSGCQWLGATPPEMHTKWGVITMADASTMVHSDRTATAALQLDGAKMWYLANEGKDVPGADFKGRMDTMYAYQNWHPMTSCTIDHSFEGVLLEPQDALFIRPNTPHYVLTVLNSVMRGLHFIPEADIFGSIWAHIHTALLDQGLTNVAHEDALVMFIQIQAFWVSNLKAIGKDEAPPSKYVLHHIPDVGTWTGLLQVVSLGNFINFLEALNYQSYLDLSPNSEDALDKDQIEAEKLRRQFSAQMEYARRTFADFRCWFLDNYKVLSTNGGHPLDIEKDIFLKSVLHLAVVLTFYKRVDHNVEPSARLWTPKAFEAKLVQALQSFDPSSQNVEIVKAYKELVSHNEPPGFGRFIPWSTESAFLVEKLTDLKRRREADEMGYGSQDKRQRMGDEIVI